MRARFIKVLFSTYFLVLSIIGALPAFVFFFIFAREASVTKQRMFITLTTLFGVFIIHNFFAIYQLVFENQALGAFVIKKIFFILTLYALVVLLEMFEKHSPFSARVTIFTALAAAIIGAMLTTSPILDPVDQTIHYDSNFVHGLEIIFALMMVTWYFGTFYSSRKAAKNPAQKHLVWWLACGTLLVLTIGVAAPQFFEIFHGAITQIDFNEISAVIEFCGTLGMFMVGWGFYRVSKHPWLLQRQQVHLLLVYSNQGIDLFSKIYHPGISTSDVTLLTGGFSAITSLFQETTKTSGGVQAILFET